MMGISSFAEAQKSHNIIYPKFTGSINSNEECIPFVKLLDGKESSEVLEKRWQLYHQLHSTFHSQVDNILDNIETDLKNDISRILLNNNTATQKKTCFNTLFLIGSDSTTDLGYPNVVSETEVNAVIDLTPKESPNVRMMLRRSMFKLFLHAEEILHRRNNDNSNSEKQMNSENYYDDHFKEKDISNIDDRSSAATSYDLT